MDYLEPSPHLREHLENDPVLRENWESIVPRHDSFEPTLAPELPSEVDSFLMWQASSNTVGITSSMPAFLVLDFGMADELATRIPVSSYPTYMCDVRNFEPIPFCPMPDDEISTLAAPVLSAFKQNMVDGLIDKRISFEHVERNVEEQRSVLESHVREKKPAPTYKKPVMPVRSSYQYFVWGWVSDRRDNITKAERVPLVCILGVFTSKKEATSFVDAHRNSFSFPLNIGERYKWLSGDQYITLEQVQNYVRQTDADEEQATGDAMEE